MKHFQYIDKVLAHISAKQEKTEIEAELFDHLDERSAYWADIGYDQEAADKKAEENMGSADVTGEQLDAVTPHRRALYPVLAAFSLAVFIVAFNVITEGLDYELYFGWNFGYFYTDISPVWASLITCAVIVFGLFNVITGLRKKRYFNLIAGAVSSEGMFVFSPYILSEYISAVMNRRSYAKSLYGPLYQEEHLGFQQLNATDAVLIGISILLFFTVLLFGTGYLRRTRLLKSTQRDLAYRNIAIVVCIAVSAILILFNGVLLYGVCTVRSEVFNEASTELQEADRAAIKALAANSPDKRSKALCALENGNYRYLWVSGTQEQHSAEFYITLMVSDPLHFFYDEAGYPFAGADFSTVHSLNGVPLPADIHYSLSEEMHCETVNFQYGSQAVLLAFDRSLNGFKVVRSPAIQFDAGAELSQAQSAALEQLIYSNAEAYYHTEYEGCFWRILNVEYSEEYDLYHLDCAEALYDTGPQLTTGLEISCIIAELTDNGVVPYSYEHFDDFGDGGSETETHLSAEAYHKYKGLSKNLYSLTEADYKEKNAEKFSGEKVKVQQDKHTRAESNGAVYTVKDSALYFHGKGTAVYGDDSETATDVLIARNVKQVQACGDIVMYLTEGGGLYAFGVDSGTEDEAQETGVLGKCEESYGSGREKYAIMVYHAQVPANKANLVMSGVRSFSMTDSFAAAVSTGGTLWFWGYNSHCQNGRRERKIIETPIMIETSVAFVKCFDYNIAYITENGSLYLCGDNSKNAVGNGKASVPFGAANEESIVSEPYRVLEHCNHFWVDGMDMMATDTQGRLYRWGAYSPTPILQ